MALSLLVTTFAPLCRMRLLSESSRVFSIAVGAGTPVAGGLWTSRGAGPGLKSTRGSVHQEEATTLRAVRARF
jgi:hypothetical protein